METEKLPACLRSLGVPDLASTSRSTKLIDISPRVSPDIKPANNTRSTITKMCTKKFVSQHLYSTAIQLALALCLSAFSLLQNPERQKENPSLCQRGNNHQNSNSSISRIFESNSLYVLTMCAYIQIERYTQCPPRESKHSKDSFSCVFYSIYNQMCTVRLYIYMQREREKREKEREGERQTERSKWKGADEKEKEI